jgi:hypothetical protein
VCCYRSEIGADRRVCVGLFGESRRSHSLMRPYNIEKNTDNNTIIGDTGRANVVQVDQPAVADHVGAHDTNEPASLWSFASIV